ncbi:MAG: Flp pilus assembly complex ATPase component TadA, partial [Elusimicrobiales bacterium]|nr:Flp pilus assembly complex ATPase component TadA [Elusimicrobiales bacterium]
MAFWGQNKPEEKNTSQENKPSSPNQVNQPSDGTLANDYQNLIKTKGRSPAIDLAIKLSDLLLEHAIRERTSDIHIEMQGTNLRVRFRVDGILQDMLITPKSSDIPLTQRIRVLAGFDPEPPKSFRNEEGRFQKMISNRAIQIRVSSFPTVNGEKLVLRVLDRQGLGMDLDKLGMNKDTLTVIKKLIRNPYGIFFITGSTGSGKTTSLYALLKNISTPMINIITLEDPVEYKLAEITQVPINEGIGFTFANALRSVLRQDPDIVMLGEIRDLDTAEIATRAALTGHFVLSTLHTNDTVATISRLIDIGLEPFLVTSA